MGSGFRPTGKSGVAPTPVRAAQIGAGRAINSLPYGGRGQAIAAQKYVSAAKEASAFHAKNMKGSSAYPKQTSKT